MLRKVAVLANPRAGNGRSRVIARESRRQLLGWECDFYFPTDRKQMDHLCLTILQKNYDALLLLGGDGTFQSGLPHFLKFPRTPIGLLPLGTANDLAAELQVEIHWMKIQEMLDHRMIGALDVITVNNIPFVTVGGFGAGSAVLKEYNSKRNDHLWFKLLHRISRAQIYGLLSAKTVLTSTAFHQRISIEGEGINGEYDTAAVFICNQQKLGKDMLVAPNAKNSDGLFETLIIPAVSSVELMKVLLSLRAGKIPKSAVSFQGSRLVVRSIDDKPISVFGDGEALTEAKELAFEILPKALRVFRFSDNPSANLCDGSQVISIHDHSSDEDEDPRL